MPPFPPRRFFSLVCHRKEIKKLWENTSSDVMSRDDCGRKCQVDGKIAIQVALPPLSAYYHFALIDLDMCGKRLELWTFFLLCYYVRFLFLRSSCRAIKEEISSLGRDLYGENVWGPWGFLKVRKSFVKLNFWMNLIAKCFVDLHRNWLLPSSINFPQFSPQMKPITMTRWILIHPQRTRKQIKSRDYNSISLLFDCHLFTISNSRATLTSFNGYR